MEYYLAIKNKENLPFVVTWMDLEDITLSKMSDKERQILYNITYIRSKKYNKLDNITTTKKQTHRYREKS